MDVYIIGGQRRHYLNLQLRSIRENVLDLTSIRYVHGPFHRSGRRAGAQHRRFVDLPGVENLTIRNRDVRPSLKSFRMPAIIRHIVHTWHEGDSLILHGDCWPCASLTADIILVERKGVWANPPSLHWSCFRGPHWLDSDWWKDTTSWGTHISAVMRRGVFPIGVGHPGFVHAGDLAIDDETEIGRKLKVLERHAEHGMLW